MNNARGRGTRGTNPGTRFDRVGRIVTAQDDPQWVSPHDNEERIRTVTQTPDNPRPLIPDRLRGGPVRRKPPTPTTGFMLTRRDHCLAWSPEGDDTVGDAVAVARCRLARLAVRDPAPGDIVVWERGTARAIVRLRDGKIETHHLLDAVAGPADAP